MKNDYRDIFSDLASRLLNISEPPKRESAPSTMTVFVPRLQTEQSEPKTVLQC